MTPLLVGLSILNVLIVLWCTAKAAISEDKQEQTTYYRKATICGVLALVFLIAAVGE